MDFSPLQWIIHPYSGSVHYVGNLVHPYSGPPPLWTHPYSGRGGGGTEESTIGVMSLYKHNLFKGSRYPGTNCEVKL